MTVDLKKIATARTELDFHVRLIMRQENITKSRATAQAYLEGQEGIGVRLGEPPKPNEEQTSPPINEPGGKK